jgi:hypothetical protein
MRTGWFPELRHELRETPAISLGCDRYGITEIRALRAATGLFPSGLLGGGSGYRRPVQEGTRVLNRSPAGRNEIDFVFGGTASLLARVLHEALL